MPEKRSFLPCGVRGSRLTGSIQHIGCLITGKECTEVLIAAARAQGTQWLALGLVSRVSPVHTALRNCTRDEGRSFEVGNQVLISSHRKLLSSKAMVVNVAEKSEQDFDRHD